jgi:hypothetical protein
MAAFAGLALSLARCSSSGSGSGAGEEGGVAGDGSGASSGGAIPSDGGNAPHFEAGPPDHYIGGCRFAGNAGAVPTDGGLLHGLTVLATGVQAAAGLEVDATYAYFGTSDSIERIPLAGGAPVVMVSGSSPGAMALVGSEIIWIDGSLPMQTQILAVPVTAVGWAVPAPPGDGGVEAGAVDAGADGNVVDGGRDGGGDAAPAQAPMILASVPGNPGALDVANGYVYFAADGVISRVPVAGGAVQLVAQGLGPTGIAAAPTVVYLGDGNNETIDQAMIGVPDGGFIGLFATSAASTTQVAIGNGGKDLYWGDWFGGIDHCPIAMPYHVDVFGTPCSGGACYPRHVRAGGPGVVWESGDNICGAAGTASPTGSALLVEGIAAIQAVAADAQHLYASTVLGELLRMNF